MGPSGFQYKYGIYPHNIPLELLCETGLLGFIPYMLLVLYAIIKLFLIGKKDPHVRHFLLFLLAYAIQACMSGSIWRNGVLLCAIGFAIVCPWPPKTQKLSGKESHH